MVDSIVAQQVAHKYLPCDISLEHGLTCATHNGQHTYTRHNSIILYTCTTGHQLSDSPNYNYSSAQPRQASLGPSEFDSATHTLCYLCTSPNPHLTLHLYHHPPSRMDRSAQELVINFTVVLITLLIMWLLVKTYQD
ncbi:hypothetical protein AAFF_G00168620 [Aldrovandia affinis]|uniref:Uncharacterized protein n=1 Tax=Aldrovandia affinis TaxID=143900 RepID=A0AAD7RM82_9TELE|nr:hypothetical protein AAFF_G00168620 [Aldrovandia affinis]